LPDAKKRKKKPAKESAPQDKTGDVLGKNLHKAQCRVSTRVVFEENKSSATVYGDRKDKNSATIKMENPQRD